MKKIFFLLLSGFCIVSAQAQYKNSPIQLSVLLSGGSSWIYTDSENFTRGSVRPVFDGEIHLDYYFQEHFAFSTGAAWSMNGGGLILLEDAQFSFLSGPDTLVAGQQLIYSLQFVEIPLGLKMSTREIGYTTFFADFGVRPMWRLNATASTVDETVQSAVAIKEVVPFNIGYQVEGGIKYSFGNKTCLIVSGFYRNTFLDFTTDVMHKMQDNSRINQAGIRIGFGF